MSDPVQTSETALTPEQKQLLASVTAIDQSIEQPIAHDEQGNPVEPEQQVSALQENTAILAALVITLTPALPFLKECYPPQTIQQIAAAYTAVEEKRGWNARQFLSVEF